MYTDLAESMERAAVGFRTVLGAEVRCLGTCTPECHEKSGDSLTLGSCLQACAALGMLAVDVDDSFHVLMVWLLCMWASEWACEAEGFGADVLCLRSVCQRVAEVSGVHVCWGLHVVQDSFELACGVRFQECL